MWMPFKIILEKMNFLRHPFLLIIHFTLHAILLLTGIIIYPFIFLFSHKDHSHTDDLVRPSS